MKTITSRQNPAVRAFRDLADHPDPAGVRLLLDGTHLVRDAAEAGVDFEMVGVAASHQEQGTEAGLLAAVLADRGVEVLTVPDSLFGAISPVRSPSGIVAIGRRPAAAANDVLGGPSPLVIVVADVQDPGNVGAVIRVAEAAGATGAVVSGASANPFSWKALRGGMGSSLRLPTSVAASVSQVVADIRKARLHTVAAVARGGVEPDAVAWDGGVALLVGGEGPGLSDELIAASDERVTIPMAPRVESLNVSVAAAILLYAARRQRAGRGLSASPREHGKALHS
jgi:TrmH family RNA methyltransferase